MFDTTRAKCHGTDPKPWGKDGPPTDAMRRFCRVCPLFHQCLDYAITNREYGIWAGTSKRERDALKAGKLRAACPMCKAETPHKQQNSQICAFCGFGWPVRFKRADPAR